MKPLTVLFSLFVFVAQAQQNNIAHFSIWTPKPGQESNFENGYKQHLKWHAANNDTWDWYGWYVISGERTGQFIDATFGHSWSDFDKPVNPAGDRADNDLHTMPFGKFTGGYKLAHLPELSTTDTEALKAKFLRIITIITDDAENARNVFSKLRSKHSAGQQSPGYLVYKVVDGGNLNEWQMLIGHQNFASFAVDENLPEELSAIERSLKVHTILSAKVETLRYVKEMSLFANGK